MKKLRNPYREMLGYRCFGCSPDNEQGLRMEFYDEGEYIVCNWNPRECFQGYLDVLHGGIQATLMDEIASYVVMTKLKTAGVTSRADVRFLKPVSATKGTVKIRAKLEEHRHRVAVILTELFNAEGQLAAEGHISYFIFPEEVARRKFHYPGPEEFYTS